MRRGLVSVASRPEIVVAEAVLAAMADVGLAALPLETGGVLAGFRAGEQIVVTRAFTLTDAASTLRSYVRREAGAQAWLADLLAAGPPVVGYVGEWHTHPANQPPSPTDRSSLRDAASASGDLVALLVLPFHGGQPRPIHGLVGQRRTGLRPPLVGGADVTTSCADAAELEARAQAVFILDKETGR